MKEWIGVQVDCFSFRLCASTQHLSIEPDTSRIRVEVFTSYANSHNLYFHLWVCGPCGVSDTNRLIMQAIFLCCCPFFANTHKPLRQLSALWEVLLSNAKEHEIFLKDYHLEEKADAYVLDDNLERQFQCESQNLRKPGHSAGPADETCLKMNTNLERSTKAQNSSMYQQRT